jgi:hypothetical protein
VTSEEPNTGGIVTTLGVEKILSNAGRKQQCG